MRSTDKSYLEALQTGAVATTRMTYTDEFKSGAVQLIRSGRSIGSVAVDLGINHWTLRDWARRDGMPSSSKKKPGKKRASPSAKPAVETAEQELLRLKRENARLVRENEALKVDREILKKAAAFFAKESE